MAESVVSCPSSAADLKDALEPTNPPLISKQNS